MDSVLQSIAEILTDCMCKMSRAPYLCIFDQIIPNGKSTDANFFLVFLLLLVLQASTSIYLAETHTYSIKYSVYYFFVCFAPS